MTSARVSVQRRFRRSIRVDADRDDAAAGFVWTTTTERAISVMSEHVKTLGHGAFTWTGTYGCGKSSLAALLAASASADEPRRSELLAAMPERVVADLARLFANRTDPWRVVPVVGRREDARSSLAAAVRNAGESFRGDPLDHLLRSNGKGGTLVIFDEMGKLLEHAASVDGDAHFLQELAEAANRSEGRLIVVGILHQAFDDYSSRLSREVREEWLKIQGRFVDVQLSPTAAEQIDLLSRAIVADGAPDTRNAAETVARAMVGMRIGAETIAAQLARCSPLDPLVAALLGPLSKRRFGQNQRSIFGFLGSAEPHGFQDFLQAGSHGLYRAWMLWAYLRANLEPSIMASPDGHRWALAVEAVERCEAKAADETTLAIVKTIALLDLLRDRSGIAASPAVLAAAIGEDDQGVVERALATLSSWSVIAYRRHLSAYSLFSGSDFDIDAAMDTARRQVIGCDFSRLREGGVLSPVLAKRHYDRTGAMRWFNIEIVTLDEAGAFDQARSARGSAGTFLLVVNDLGLTKAGLRARMDRMAERLEAAPVMIGTTAQSYALREMVQELEALDRLQGLHPELRGDPVARREIAARQVRLADELEERLRDVLANAQWRAPMLPDVDFDEVPTGASRLTVLASSLADGLYPKSPMLRNELLNRARPSSNAMAGLRALMVAMVRAGGAERLDISGYPPEMGLYISLLARTGLHDPAAEGHFVTPTEDDAAGLHASWLAADALLNEAGSEGLSLGTLHAVWSERPFGIKAGLLPLLSLTYLLSRLTAVSVYLDGLFCASVNDLLVDRLLQEPASVRMRASSVSAEQKELLASLGEVLSEVDGQPAQTAVDSLALARRLVGYVVALPTWVRRTSRLEARARAVRDVALSAHDPNGFLLDDLPEVLASGDDGPVANLRHGLRRLAVAYGDLLAGLSGTMLDELRVGPGLDELDRLRDRARNIAGISGNFRLDALATRLTTFDGSQTAIEGILSLAANKPPRDWTDRDVDAARLEIASMAQEFLRTEGLAHVQGRQAARTSIAVFISDPGRPSLLKTELTVGGRDAGRVRALAGRLQAALGDDLSPELALAVVAELGARLMEGQAAADAEGMRGAA